MRERFDAIVIGGGPAGSLSALFLARQGWRVALLEKGTRNRSKTCGHCLSPRALPILKQAGILDHVAVTSAGTTAQLYVHVVGRTVLQLVLHEGLLVERHIVDQTLLDHANRAGVEIFQPATALIQAGRVCIAYRALPTPVAVSIGGRCPPYTITAPLIIGADGLRSRVAQAFSAQPVRIGRKFGFSFDLPWSKPTAENREPTAIDMFVDGGGYLGLVEQTSGCLHVAGLIGSGIDSIPREPIAFCRFMAERFAALQAIGLHEMSRADAKNFTAAGPLPWRPRTVSGSAFALVGDAAGYIEPFTGEGMTWAIQSAHALAEVTSCSRPGEWNDELAERYETLWRERIGAAQKRCAWIAWTLERPWAFGAACRIARVQPRFANRLVREVIAA